MLNQTIVLKEKFMTYMNLTPSITSGWHTKSIRSKVKNDIRVSNNFSGLARILQNYIPISLKEMDSVKLLNRVDTKYILPASVLEALLVAIEPEYRVLMINGRLLNHYRTLYFDTPGFDLFNLHVNGNAERYKVRSREYLDTRESFLEVKLKTRKDRTIKQRLATRNPIFSVNGEAEDWLENIYPFNTNILEPKTCNTFTRITLVNRERCERVTIDTNIRFCNPEHATTLNGIAVAEVKMDVNGNTSPFKIQMRNMHIHPDGFSKYCLGTALLYDGVKKNGLKPKILWIEKISKGVTHE